MEALEVVVLKKENMVLGVEEARRVMTASRGAAWVPNGNARTATCPCVVVGMIWIGIWIWSFQGGERLVEDKSVSGKCLSRLQLQR